MTYLKRNFDAPAMSVNYGYEYGCDCGYRCGLLGHVEFVISPLLIYFLAVLSSRL